MPTKDYLLLETTTNIEHKINWAIRSLHRIKSSGSDKIEVQDHFWSFITAFQQCRYYLNRMIDLRNPDITTKKRKDIFITSVESWKHKTLTELEVISWNILTNVRN